MSSTTERDLQEIGRNSYESLVDMVNALECDYDRLEELSEEHTELVKAIADAPEDVNSQDMHGTVEALAVWDRDNGEEFRQLLSDAGESESREDAEQRIQEDALSVEVRSGWVALGEPMEAEDFNILLCTGGPAVRIMGELRDGEPYRAWLEVQDWGTPWTQYFGASQDVLLTYSRQFYFGA